MTFRRSIASALAAATLLSGVAATAADAGTYQGCPRGYVCLYPGAGWNNGRPSAKYYYYGTYNLRNQYGVKRLFNNQTGRAKAYVCNGWNGNGPCSTPLSPWTYFDYNFTPINSIKLTR